MPPKRKAAAELADTTAHQMSSADPKPTSNKKGPGSKVIARYEAMSEEEKLAMLADVERLKAAVDAHRPGTLATQHKQDVHLRYYRAYICCSNHLNSNASDTDVDALVWPVDHEKLYEQLKGFLVFMFANAKGRGLSNRMACAILSQCREAMRFWVLRECKDLSDSDYKMMKEGMTETMRFLRNK